jgi:hypothetical protein
MQGANSHELPASLTSVGVRGFEPPTTSTPLKCATGLRYTPPRMLDYLAYILNIDIVAKKWSGRQAPVFTQVKCDRGRYTSLKRKGDRVRGTMPTEDQMTVNDRRNHLNVMKPRYVAAGRAERGSLLTEMEQVTGLHRKHLTRVLNAASLERQPRMHQRQGSSGQEVEQVILTVWERLDSMCAERLTPSLLATARHLARFGAVQVTAAIERDVQTISRATVARLLSKHRTQKVRVPRKGPERAHHVTKGVPMGRIPWNLLEPGHVEVDLVHHCGESTVGEYGHTLHLIDVATGWSERIMVFGRSQRAMEAAFRSILARVPCAVRELHPDNGSAFFNQHLVRFWKEKVVGMTLSRSRPFQEKRPSHGRAKKRLVRAPVSRL